MGEPTCRACGQPAQTRDEAADLAVGWLLYDPATATAVSARFHQGCRPPGVPGALECVDCGDGPLLAGELATPADLLTTAALTGWLEDQGWTGEPGRGRELRCPECRPHQQRARGACGAAAG